MDVLFSFGIRLSVSNKIQFCIIFIYPEILLFIKAIKSQFCLKGDSLRRRRTLETVVEVRPTLCLCLHCYHCQHRMQATGGIKALFANFLFSRLYISTIGQARAIAHLAQSACLISIKERTSYATMLPALRTQFFLLVKDKKTVGLEE